jgi:hypothetical protein
MLYSLRGKYPAKKVVAVKTGEIFIATTRKANWDRKNTYGEWVKNRRGYCIGWEKRTPYCSLTCRVEEKSQ